MFEEKKYQLKNNKMIVCNLENTFTLSILIFCNCYLFVAKQHPLAFFLHQDLLSYPHEVTTHSTPPTSHVTHHRTTTAKTTTTSTTTAKTTSTTHAPTTTVPMLNVCKYNNTSYRRYSSAE